MSGARDTILAALRAHGGTGAPAPSHRVIPARAQGTAKALRARFVAEARAAAADLYRIPSLAGLPGALAPLLAGIGAGAALAAAPDGGLDGLDWRGAGLAARFGPAESSDAVSVTPAVAGIAETGSVLVRSGPRTPNSLHLLPDTHVVVVHAENIVGGYGDGLARLMAGDNEGLPRAATLITGPSRSSDIERIVQIGVHGPRRLIIFLIDGEKTS